MVYYYITPGAGQGGKYVGIRKRGVVTAHAAEITMGAEYGRGIAKIKSEHKHAPRQSVIQPADEQFTPARAAQQVFMQQQQVIAEIQICFLRIALGQRAPPT